jgi:ectoine hydroxylase-related dioxygenase (phytanoyl-CoA dioxygenase family)
MTLAGSAAPSSGRLSSAELAAAVDDLERDGLCVLRGVLDTALVREWAAAFRLLARERIARPGAVAPRGDGRFYLTLPWQAPFSDPAVFANPDVLAVVDRVFGQPYLMVQLAADTPIRGSKYQPVHRDHSPLFGDDLVTPLYALAVNNPLCDVGLENGPLEVARGTHRLPRQEGLAAIAAGRIPLEPVRLSAGDLLVRTPLALHRGTPNRTAEPRPMVVLGYVMRWLHTPKVELTVPRGAYAALPEHLRALLRCDVVESLPDAPVETYAEFEY